MALTVSFGTVAVYTGNVIYSDFAKTLESLGGILG
jgi:hypothetical protein